MIKWVAGALALAGVAVGFGWVAGQGGASLGAVPALAVLTLATVLAQWVAFVPAAALRSERFYDLTGSITTVSITCAAVALSPNRGLRELLLAAVVCAWALRLGIFLFRRVRKDGKDGRFDEIKTAPAQFLFTWTLQGLWIALTTLAAWTVITSEASPPLAPLDAVGATLWAVGFAVEVIADAQKSRWKAHPSNAGRWIEVGLWRWSRHPNYLGEIVLWIGVAVIAASALSGWQWIALVSPVFVVGLLARGSGVPLLEQRADAKWGGEPAYEAYKARVSVLVPGMPWLR